MQVIHLSPLVNTTPLPSQGSSALKSSLSDQILVVLGLPCSQHPLHPAPRPLFRLQGSTRRKEGINIFKGSLNTLGTFHSSHWDLYQAGITLITVFFAEKNRLRLRKIRTLAQSYRAKTELGFRSDWKSLSLPTSHFGIFFIPISLCSCSSPGSSF